ncbi:alpha/beta hydrolase [Streptomyces sp. NBC_01220]|nr:alpha/beta hydrolase [Streptomyces sp. NBC_01220]
MTTFVLVHGAWHGSWAWERVTPILLAAGVRVVAPDLTLDRDVGLRHHVDEVVTAIDATAGDDLVLVGHSYAGLVVRQAADRRPERVAHLVLVEGWGVRTGPAWHSWPRTGSWPRCARTPGTAGAFPPPPRSRSASPSPARPAGWSGDCAASRCAPSPNPPV